MKNKYIIPLLICVFCLSSAGCSVYMAAKKEGTSMEQVNQCKTRSAVKSQQGVEVLSTDKNENGEISECYKIQEPTGSSARAAMHGVLDVATLGIWEVAGTPIEGSMGEKKYYSIKVYYDKDENVKKIELLK
jgi:hypothetical protein